jgi:hypothetical protein
MFVTLSGIVIEVSPVQKPNAPDFISFVPAGIVKEADLEIHLIIAVLSKV